VDLRLVTAVKASVSQQISAKYVIVGEPARVISMSAKYHGRPPLK
jgi:serine acetyltransferase